MRVNKERSREKRERRDESKTKEGRQFNRRQKFRKEFRDKHAPTSVSKNEKYSVNRSEVCPFLARIYYCVNGKNHFEKQDSIPKQRQMILYLWMDSTLKQITDLLRAHMAEIRTKQRFQFSRIYFEKDSFVKKQMGTVMVHKRDRKGLEGEEVNLLSQNFSIGDFIDVSINYK